MATFTKFAQEIKKKYPEYANVDDAKLAKAFIEKYPEYESQVTWTPDYTEYERKADISTTPITTRDGKVVPVNTSQLGADRVHFSDIYALNKELTPLKPEELDDPLSVQARTTAKSNEAYSTMMDEIAKAQEQADTEEYYGWVRDNKLVSIPLSIIAPSTTESIEQGKLPSWSDAAIDVPLAGSALLMAPVRGATAGATIAKNALLGAGIGAGTEGALAVAHDRELDPARLAISGALGGAGGAGTGALSSRAKGKLSQIYPTDEGVDYALGKLGRTQEQTIEKMYKDAPKALKELGEFSSKRSTRTPDINVSASVPYTIMDDVNANITTMLRDKLKSANLSGDELVAKQALMDKFNNNLIEIASLSDDKIPFNTMLNEAQDLYKKDPELGTIVINQLKPYINKMRMAKADINAIKTGVRDGASLMERSAIPASTDRLVKSMQLANMYAEQAPKIYRSPEFTGDVTKKVVDVATKSNITPEATERLSRFMRSSGARVPREVEGSSYDDEGNLLYAPEGRRSYEWLWEQADKKKKK